MFTILYPLGCHIGGLWSLAEAVPTLLRLSRLARLRLPLDLLCLLFYHITPHSRLPWSATPLGARLAHLPTLAAQFSLPGLARWRYLRIPHRTTDTVPSSLPAGVHYGSLSRCSNSTYVLALRSVLSLFMQVH